MSSISEKLIFITGVSSGFGKALAIAALAAGHRVVGTVRNEEARLAFEALRHGRATAKILDITDYDSIAPLVAQIETEIGPIDVLINNAGYGHEGLLEESPLHDLRRQFDVNVFGTVAVTKAVLPYMRARRAGHIFTITSMGGLFTYPGLSYYHGSKFALEGIFESLAQEVAPFNINIINVEPGAFRTDWAGRSMVRSKRTIKDYDALFDPIRKARMERNGRQPGDPEKAANSILKLIGNRRPPSHLLLGEDAVTSVRQKLASLGAEVDAWESVSTAVSFSAQKAQAELPAEAV
jgi:NAD(P)-dependent dehydrogenase (short-subunit alcohol dehydrogenase family)